MAGNGANAGSKWIQWTPEMDALIGTASDAKVGKALGLTEPNVRRRRVKLGLPSYRSTLGPTEVPCANCGKPVMKPLDAMRRSRRLFCTRECADAGQKRRDSETLRYGPGWKNRRAEIRRRDKVCRGCGKTPEQNGSALHVHHLVPYRYGGTNLPSNLVALCDSCHHTVEWMTDQVLSSIPVAITLDGPTLTITVDNALRWHGSVVGADGPTPTG